MYKKKLWKPVLAGTLALAMALTPLGTAGVVSAAEPEMTTEVENAEDTTTEEEAAYEEVEVTEGSTEGAENEEIPEPDQATSVSINSTTFPDSNFRSYVLSEIDKNGDSILSTEEINATKKINVDSKSISSLQGIEYFVALESLSCADNQLRSIDVSKNTKLTDLNCEWNHLSSIDVSKNTQLTVLNCEANYLTSIDVSKNTQLTDLGCRSNRLTSIDVSKNTQLTDLECWDNNLTSLDVSNNTKLTDLDCDRNQLSSIDVSKNTQLTSLSCEHNQLTNLDASKNTQLSKLICGCNKLTSLNVSKNTQLTSLSCEYNQLTNLDVSKNTQLSSLLCHGNKLTSLDLSKNAQLTSLICSGNELTSLDVSKNTQLTSLLCCYSPLTTLDLSKNTKLTYVRCYNNQLTSLDMSKNTKLEKLECYNNQLTSLDVSENTQLTDLYCSNNQLTSLDVSKSTKLKVLWCDNNQLTSLDVSQNTQLEKLDCARNQLAYLDLSKNAKIASVDTNNNEYLAGLNNKRQIDLTTIPGFKVSKMSNVSGGTLSGNILTFKSGVNKVTYTYACGNGHSATFTIAEDLTKSFCTRLYTLCLGRAADASGVNYWTAQLNSKKVTGAQVGYSFVFSDEYKKKNTSDEAYVKMLYEVFMGRSADKSGLNYWLDLLNQGMSREYVYKGFAESKEFTNICASYGIERGSVKLTQARDRNVNLTKFVNRIYVKAMNRKGEEKGLNYWCSQIQSKKMTPVQVAESFIYSKEFTDKKLSNTEYIKVLYRTFMGREADSAGLNYWLGRLNKGESRKTVLKAFAGCQEFKNIVKSFGL